MDYYTLNELVDILDYNFDYEESGGIRTRYLISDESLKKYILNSTCDDEYVAYLFIDFKDSKSIEVFNSKYDPIIHIYNAHIRENGCEYYFYKGNSLDSFNGIPKYFKPKINWAF